MSHIACIIALTLIVVPVRGCPQGGEADRARSEALKALKGGGDRPFSQDLERSKQKWPAYDREIEAGIVEQQKAVDAGGTAPADLALLLQTRAKNQESPATLYLYGRFLGALDRVDEAKAQFEAALKMDPYFPWAHHGLGTCFARGSKFQDAARSYRRALELNPGFVRSMEPLAACLMQQEQGDEAERVLKDLLKIQPDDVQPLLSLGKLLFQRTRYAEAVKQFRTVLERKPNHQEGRRCLALSLIRAGQPKDALVVYATLLKDDPSDGHVLMGMGQAHEMLGENWLAADAYQKVLDNWSSSLAPKPELLARIGDLRRAPQFEKPNPKQKSPHEWVQILLNSTEPERCREAIRVLCTYPEYEKEIYNAFLNALKNKDGPVRVLAVKELSKRWEGLSHELTPLLSLFLDDKERLVRAMVARKLGEADDPAAVPALIKAVKERDAYVFREIYDALWRLTNSDMSVLLPKDLTTEAMETAAKGWESWYADNRDRYKKYESAPK